MSENVKEAEDAKLGVTGGFTVSRFGLRTILRIAALGKEGSTDPVDEALRRATGEDAPYADVFEPASAARRYSIARGNGMTVLRGDLDAVMDASDIGRSDRALIRRNARDEAKKGRQCIGVAASFDEEAEAENDAPKKRKAEKRVHFLGFVSVKPGAEMVFPRTSTPGGMARVDVWSPSLRIQHWLDVFLIVMLSFTGYFIMDPFLVPGDRVDPGYLMGIIRFLHFGCAFVWILLAIWRVGLFFVARNRHMQARSLWPLKSREDVRNMMGTLRHYLFIPGGHPTYIGHNALQQLAYTGVYALCIIQVFTGLGLYGLAEPHESTIWVLFTVPVKLLGVPTVRLIHTLIMFILWAFVLIHVYLVIRGDVLEKSSDLSSMVNGHMLVPRGTKPADGPEVE